VELRRLETPDLFHPIESPQVGWTDPEAGEGSPASDVDRDYASGLVSSLVISIVRRSTGGVTLEVSQPSMIWLRPRLNAAAVVTLGRRRAPGSCGDPRCTTLASDPPTAVPYLRYSPFVQNGAPPRSGHRLALMARSVTGPLLASLGASAVSVGLVSGAGEATALLMRVLFGIMGAGAATGCSPSWGTGSLLRVCPLWQLPPSRRGRVGTGLCLDTWRAAT
jgi:hypothetical protein